MSASEKLKALGAILNATPPESDTAAMHKLFDLADALPHIVAVVEAMEALARWERFPEVQQFAAEPLTALEEALSPPGLSDQAFDELEQERERTERTFGG